MALFGDPVWLADVIRAEGVAVVEVEGWKTRGHGDYRELLGVLGHHTAGGGSNDWRVVLNGRPDLEGPLAQIVLEKDGSVKIICVGVAWHAGKGSWPGWPTNNANYFVIGIEAVSRGTAPWDWTDIQLVNYKKVVAAILRKMGVSAAKGFAGHREYSSEGKIDPAGIDLPAFRVDVQRIIDNPPGAVIPPGPIPSGGNVTDDLSSDTLKLHEVFNQVGKLHRVREVFQKTFYNVKDGNLWSRAGLADIWNEVVWDGYVNPVDVLDGKDDPDINPSSSNLARRGSLISYVLAIYRETVLTRRDTAAILAHLKGETN